MQLKIHYKEKKIILRIHIFENTRTAIKLKNAPVSVKGIYGLENYTENQILESLFK